MHQRERNHQEGWHNLQGGCCTKPDTRAAIIDEIIRTECHPGNNSRYPQNQTTPYDWHSQNHAPYRYYAVNLIEWQKKIQYARSCKWSAYEEIRSSNWLRVSRYNWTVSTELVVCCPHHDHIEKSNNPGSGNRASSSRPDLHLIILRFDVGILHYSHHRYAMRWGRRVIHWCTVILYISML